MTECSNRPEEPREYTNEEIRNMFYDRVWMMIDWWSKQPSKDKREAISGCVFSIFAMLDGCNLDFPACAVVTDPCEDDKEYHKKHGENWFPQNDVSSLKGNITDMALHEHFFNAQPKAGTS